MPDMLVKLYDLPDSLLSVETNLPPGVEIRRAKAPEKNIVLGWVEQQFSSVWKSECDVAFSEHPISCFIATQNGEIVGFACYDASCRNFFGPTGVQTTHQGKGIGKALLLRSLLAMKENGYAYAIIGDAGPTDFYKKAVNAEIIEGSSPGFYRGVLKEH
ncbi:hypothetical protein D3C74_123830 [compost metagenome]